MNVLFIVDGSLSNPILPSQGIPHIQENSKKGVNYSILSFEDNKLLSQNLEVKERYNYAFVELKTHAKIYSVSTDMFARFRTFRFIIRGVIKAGKIVKENKIDIIHGRSNIPALIGLIIKKIYKVKVLYDNRGLLSDEINKQEKMRIKIEQFFEKILLKGSDSVVVVSNAFKDYLNKKYYEYKLYNKISVIENSFSEKRFFYSEQFRLEQRKVNKLENKFVMVYSGPSVNWQRFDLILETFKILKELKNNAYLLVISYDSEIEEIILKSGIEKQDFGVYNLPATEVNRYLVMGDFGVIYRDERIRSKVCAPIKLGEYLASGLPILSMSSIGDTEVILNENKTGIIINDINEIKNRLKEIIDLLQDSQIRIKCRISAEKYLSLKVASSKYLSIYRDIKN